MTVQTTYQFPFAKYPAVRLLLLMATGITIDYLVDLSPILWLCTFLPCTGCYCWNSYLSRNSLNMTRHNLIIICYVGMIITFGGCWHQLFDYHEEPPEAAVLNSYTWKTLTMNGKIQQIKQSSTGKYQIDIDVDATVFPHNLQWDRSYPIRVVLDPADIPVPDNLALGNNMQVRATIYPLEPKRNPHQFDYKKYLASQNIYAQAGIQKIEHISENKAVLSWIFIRRHILNAIDNNFTNQTASLAKALLIGYKNELGRDDKMAFSRAGLSHIMAVSGLHVGFILAPFWICIPMFWSLRGGKEIGLSCLICLLFFYAGLTGFSASVTRASLVGGFLAYGKLFHKVRDSKNLTAVAALLILLVSPGDLFSIGFQLSFGAVYIILLITPVISRQLPIWIQYRWYGQPIMIVIISFIVQIGLFPLLAYYFGEFSLVGPLANAFVVPLLGIAVPLALVLLPVAMFFPGLGQTLNIPVDIFINYLAEFVQLTASWSWSWIHVHVSSPLFFISWLTAIFFIASLSAQKMRWKLLVILLFIVSLGQARTLFHTLQPAHLNITYFDVGQGDAALVETPKDKHILIDCGRWQPDYNSAKQVILPHLKARGISKLDAIFLSHPHADHIGGILSLINNIPIKAIYNSGASYDSKLYQKYLREAREKQIPVISLSAGDQVSLDSSIRLLVYGPFPNPGHSNVNNRSLILELIYGNTEFLFLGDAEQNQEQRLVSHYPELLNTDVLKVAHHGSKTSSGLSLLKTVSAQHGIISLGKQNQFSHPHPKAIFRLRNNISHLGFTSLRGAIQFSSDGRQLYHLHN